MTIFTKAVTEKKGDQLGEPLVKSEPGFEVSPVKKDVEVELPAHMYQPLQARARRVNTATTICACITAILVLTVGVIGGIYLYKHLAKSQMHRFRAFCNVPYNRDLDIFGSHYQAKQTTFSDYHDSESFEDKNNRVYFKEEIEIDIEYENYEQIVVPDFTGGRHGRFIHDFSANKTGIIDLDGHRCFVLPLNRSLVLPPKTLFDLILKMRAGYYEVDTEVVRDTMKVLYPPITDYKSVGYYIARECASLNTYMLERVPRNHHRSMRKRSADVDLASFTVYSGVSFYQLDIIDDSFASHK